jgi:hypothetical protein
MEALVQENILRYIEKLKYLETKECRQKMSKEQIEKSKKFATEMFRSLLSHRDNLKNKKINEMRCDIYA